MHTGRKALMLLAALLLLLTAHLQLGCRVSINGQTQETLYSPLAVNRAATAAAWTAEEILRGHAPIPEIRCSYRLSLRSPTGDEDTLANSLLQAVAGVKLANVVFVNGEKLGTVADGGELLRQLQNFIDRQQPHAAVSGSISGELRIRRLYTRTVQDTGYDDMLLLITGMAPIHYVDENGKLA